MRALQFDDFGGPLIVREVPDPVAPPAGVVIRVKATGLCRSDWHGWRGHDPDITLPHTPGHEFAGVVESVGALVQDCQPGDRVTVPFVCACGSCPSCLAGEQQVCDEQFQPGFTHPGSFAELVAVDRADVNLVRLPADLDFTTAASLGCRFATAYRAVRVQGRVSKDQWMAVYGCGGVGLSAVMIAVAWGAWVVAVDVNPQALELASALGAADTLLVAPTDSPEAIADKVRMITGGGSHVGVDALGSASTCVASILGLGKRGRHVQVGLLPPKVGRPIIPMDVVIGRELEIVGSHGMAARAYAAMLDEISTGHLRPDRLVSRSITLADAGSALAAMSGGGEPGVTVIEPNA